MTELTREEKYRITSESLTGLTELRKFAKTKNFEWLENLASQLNSIVEEKREEFELQKLELQEIEEKRLKALRFIEELGLNPETIHISAFESIDTKSKGKKAKSAPKYRFTHPESGKTETWTGVGRMKKGLQQLIEAGHSLDEFLIDKVSHAKDDIKEAEKLFENHPSSLG
ncbi:H-NS family nucleoid-associated regulatory protein [Providencia alcalifaciens]|uniref:H-NS histone family protein n=1 Tax=Providencia alcalifaciens 205/92 TaxID=1256988 RepID=A0AAV3M577_9GAMM|nr:H-NS family nucleoid-associated regulatory protein [Providencia alcalifaciens]EUD10807.1 H-NS histone family protein [Providencia alcalifaciens 205/92]MTC25127.1 H-NS histone family protein [Providencia alcalifaciens]MTC61817.1 H-NS histone family protein [Providencia alcalifaciens]